MQCPNRGEILTNSSFYEYSIHSWIQAKQNMKEYTYLLCFWSSFFLYFHVFILSFQQASQLVASPMLTPLKLCSSFFSCSSIKYFTRTNWNKEQKVELAWFAEEHSDDQRCDKKDHWLLVASEQQVGYIFPIGDGLLQNEQYAYIKHTCVMVDFSFSQLE